ncbi:hypothetical protein ACHHYP_20052 [Achlya hypogyna]|uniref:PX domain-containing protein n=1 Tax=Achlya hypogyna TaxID=1202772 RepID=A0A1V9ZTW2_ACHHY|nr:hypothetical protein ACHHYP_20052 [Achlya hypogyna]
MVIGLDVTAHVEASGKTVRFYVEMRSDAIRFGFNGRFSQLRALHMALAATLRTTDPGLGLPPFPPKHMLENMSSPANVARRRNELFDYYTLLATNDVAVAFLAAQPETTASGVTFTQPVQVRRRH